MKHQKSLTIIVAILLAALTSPGRLSAQWGDTYRLAAHNASVEKANAKARSGSNVTEDSATQKVRNAKIAILTDLSQSTTGGGDSQKKIGNGRLGIAFVTSRMYGDLSFAVFTSDRSRATGVLTDTAFFYNNLLLAQHQTGGLNEVAGNFGINGLFQKDGRIETGRRAWRNNVGLQCNFRSSNQYWAKDSVYTDVLLNALSLMVSYQVFNFKVESESWDHLQLFVYSGFTTRRLGGNYALDSNAALRVKFLGTDKFVFNGWEYGVRLEVGPFYGQASFTEFNRIDNIPGFSGPQLAVKIGAAIKLDLNGTF